MRDKTIYWISTILFCLLMLMSASMYFFNYEKVKGIFESLGYPTHLIYPLAFAKILGVIAILSKISPFLKQMAYAGFFYDFLLAVIAHFAANDGEYVGALIALVLMSVSYFYDRKLFAV